MSANKKVDSINHQLYHDPKPKDFLIPGELLKIKVNFNSFTVYFQFPGEERWEHQLRVLKRTYPIQSISAFFAYNGKIESKYFAHRPPSFWEEFKY